MFNIQAAVSSAGQRDGALHESDVIEYDEDHEQQLISAGHEQQLISAGYELSDSAHDDDDTVGEIATALNASSAQQPAIANSLVHTVKRSGHTVAHDVVTVTNSDKPWPAPWRRGQQSDDTSQLLSEKMLQGWALLEKCCPRYSLVSWTV
jgi:hypothetical protein